MGGQPRPGGLQLALRLGIMMAPRFIGCATRATDVEIGDVVRREVLHQPLIFLEYEASNAADS